jgi:hypothetical protein
MLRFLVNDQRDTQIFTTYLFLFLTLYMCRAHRAHHRERQNCVNTTSGNCHSMSVAVSCLFLTLYMFRAHYTHHQERQTVSIQPLVTVILSVAVLCAGQK